MTREELMKKLSQIDNRIAMIKRAQKLDYPYIRIYLDANTSDDYMNFTSKNSFGGNLFKKCIDHHLFELITLRDKILIKLRSL